MITITIHYLHCGISRNKDVNPNILRNFGAYAKRRIRAILFG